MTDLPNCLWSQRNNAGDVRFRAPLNVYLSREFFVRHKDKLIFGSDCSCADGKEAGISQNNNPEAARLAGKCAAVRHSGC